MAQPQTEKTPPQAQQQRSEPPIKIDYNTSFLSPGYEEIEAAAVFLRNKFPHLEEDLLNEVLKDRINIAGINRGSVIYVVCRKQRGRKRLTEAQQRRRGPEGDFVTERTEPELLAAEVELFGPVLASDFWTESDNRWMSELNRPAFISALGKIAAPWAIKQPDCAGKKNGEEPNFVTLGNC